MQATIIVYRNGKEILNRVLSPGVYRAGRARNSDIRLEEKSVSREHLELRIAEDSAYLTNLTSTGAVKRNGEPCETGEIADGDELLVGPFRILFFHGARPDPAAIPAWNEPEADALPSRTDLEASPLAARIQFLEGPRTGEEVRIDAYECTLGRSQKADIYLADEKLSRIHAKIARVGGGFRLVDLNSRNGIQVNGMRVLEHELQSFDEIKLGNCRFQFLIHDPKISELSDQRPRSLPATIAAPTGEPTRSLILAPQVPTPALPVSVSARLPVSKRDGAFRPVRSTLFAESALWAIAVVAIVAGLVLLQGRLSRPMPRPESGARPLAAMPSVPGLPDGFQDLTPMLQRRIEDWYASANQAAREGNFTQALTYLGELHGMVPFYKDSRSMAERLADELSRKSAQASTRVSSPKNSTLDTDGDDGDSLESMEKPIARATPMLPPPLVPAEKKPKAAWQSDGAKRHAVNELLAQASEALDHKHYQRAIDLGEQVRAIELRGETSYLNLAKQVIDNARRRQKNEFEPFLAQARDKYAQGDYTASRDLCEEMLKQDDSYTEARNCLVRARDQLNYLAQEAYSRGYILESMNRLQEARQLWLRAKSYVRPGDDYYDKVMLKLTHYHFVRSY